MLRSDTPTRISFCEALPVIAKNPSSCELGWGLLSDGGFMLWTFAFAEQLTGWPNGCESVRARPARPPSRCQQLLKLHDFSGGAVRVPTLAGFHDVGEGGQQGPGGAVLEVVEGWLSPFVDEGSQQASAHDALFPGSQHHRFCRLIRQFGRLQRQDSLSFQFAIFV